jgi:hypothetical protein
MLRALLVTCGPVSWSSGALHGENAQCISEPILINGYRQPSIVNTGIETNKSDADSGVNYSSSCTFYKANCP